MNKIFIAIIVVISFISLGYFFSSSTIETGPRIILGTELNCNPLKKMCWATGNGVAIGLRLPFQAQYLKPFSTQATIKGIENRNIKKVTITFEMSGMDMGQNQFVLKQKKQVNNYSGDVILPVCVTGRTDWTAKVEVSTVDKIYQGDFKISITK